MAAAMRVATSLGREELVGLLGLLFALDLHLAERLKLEKGLNQMVAVLGEEDGAGLGQALHPGSEVGGVSDGGVVHTEIIADFAHHHGARVEADAELEVDAILLLQLLPVVRQGFLDGKGGMAGSLGMVLVGQRGAEEGHHPIAGELVDGALVAMDLIHEDLKAPVQDLMDLFRVQLLREGGVGGHVGEEDSDDLALPFYRGAGGEDLVGQVLGGVGSGDGVVGERGGRRELGKFMTTFATELLP